MRTETHRSSSGGARDTNHKNSALFKFLLRTVPSRAPARLREIPLLLPASLRADILWNSGSCSHFHILLKVSRPDFSLLQGLGFLSRSDRVPWERHSTLWAKMAWGMLYLLSSAVILCATSLVLISSSCPELFPPCVPEEEGGRSRLEANTGPWDGDWRWGVGVLTHGGNRVPRVVHPVQVGHHAGRRATEAPVLVVVPPGQHGGSVARVEVQHLVVASVRRRAVVVEPLLGVVYGAQAVAQHRGETLTHPGHVVFVVGAVQVVHARQPPVVPHQGEAPAHVPGEPLVVVVVMVVVVELVGHGGDGGQRLQRSQGGVGAAHPHPGRGRVARDAHGVVQRQRQLRPVLPAAVQDRGHAGNHGRAGRQVLVYPQGRRRRRRRRPVSPRRAPADVVRAVAAHELRVRGHGAHGHPAMQTANAVHCHVRVHGVSVQVLGQASIGVSVGGLHSSVVQSIGSSGIVSPPLPPALRDGSVLGSPSRCAVLGWLLVLPRCLRLRVFVHMKQCFQLDVAGLCGGSPMSSLSSSGAALLLTPELSTVPYPTSQRSLLREEEAEERAPAEGLHPPDGRWVRPIGGGRRGPGGRGVGIN